MLTQQRKHKKSSPQNQYTIKEESQENEMSQADVLS